MKAHTPEYESFERDVARINEYLRGEQDGAVANIMPDSFLVAADLVARQTSARITYIKNMSLLEEFGGQGIVQYVYVAPNKLKIFKHSLKISKLKNQVLAMAKSNNGMHPTAAALLSKF